MDQLLTEDQIVATLHSVVSRKDPVSVAVRARHGDYSGAGTGLCTWLLSGPADGHELASAASGCRVRLHHPRQVLGCPLFSLHPGASRCRYLVTRLRFPGANPFVCQAAVAT